LAKCGIGCISNLRCQIGGPLLNGKTILSHVNHPLAQMTDYTTQLLWLFILGLPVACISWTFTHEEVFREPRSWCMRRSQEGKRLMERKFFYLFTCEYCFSHYVTVFFLFVTRFQLLFPDWRGYLISGFALVFVANFYMSLYARIKVDIKKDRIIAEKEEKLVSNIEKDVENDRHRNLNEASEV
jgi:hypothetical protein